MYKKLSNKLGALLIKSAFFLISLILFAQNIYSQYLIRDSEREFDFKNNTHKVSSILLDSLVISKKDTVVSFQMKKSPWKSVLYSAILPGLGQFYNESYWKVPIILTIGGYLGYVVVKNHNKFLDYRDQYANSQTPENPEGDLRLRSYREFYRDQRDQFLLYFAFYYLITLVDAYVDAHLYDFDVSESIKFTISPPKKFFRISISF
ncbi:MAG: DUF5683 domain-containing protein [Ignavibacteria bacterium]|nr:DUF5683 domain-containing protein [Ignavibacteria bacterium]